MLLDIENNMTAITRYSPIRLMEVPEEKLEWFREANRAKCERDPLMPKYSPTMRFALLTKTHFCHAHKLINDGSRRQFNSGGLPAKLIDEDAEGRMIQDYGVDAIVYGPEIWSDPAHHDRRQSRC